MGWQTAVPDVAGFLTVTMVGTVEGSGNGGGGVGQGGTHSSSISGVDIPRNATTDVPLSVDGLDGVVSDVLMGLYLIHNRVGDLELRLISQAGTSILLFDNRGGLGDNIGVRASLCIFDDAATTAIAAGAAPYTGRFRPEAPLSGVNGEAPNGTWKLRIINSGNQGGTLGFWTLLVGSTSQDSIGGSPLTGFLLPRH